jgi:hypothetical protein
MTWMHSPFDFVPSTYSATIEHCAEGSVDTTTIDTEFSPWVADVTAFSARSITPSLSSRRRFSAENSLTSIVYETKTSTIMKLNIRREQMTTYPHIYPP